jgi:hypothetical protein
MKYPPIHSRDVVEAAVTEQALGELEHLDPNDLQIGISAREFLPPKVRAGQYVENAFATRAHATPQQRQPISEMVRTPIGTI